MARRAYTSYDHYQGYSQDNPYEDLYPGPISGVYTPQPMDRAYTPKHGDLPYNSVPEQGRISSAGSGRPKSSQVHSRAEVTVQTEKKLRPKVSETQYNYAIPDENVRPTSPVQRVLDKWHAQPTMAVQGPPPGSVMDPITRQYYHRMWSNRVPKNEITLNRYGRAGGVWRHVRSCVANTGNQLAFIDGTVKEEDNVFFPAWKSTHGRKQQRPGSYTGYRTQPTMLNASYIPVTNRAPGKKSYKYRNKFNTHAKEGFKYWYEEEKPIDSKLPYVCSKCM
ncbi:hypothetical protein ACF0H5_002385 [Mactra antiquata]